MARKARKAPFRSLFTPSEEALSFYVFLVERMKTNGYIDQDESLEISHEAVEQGWSVKDISQFTTELTRGSLMFPAIDETRNGWIIRLPVAKF